jgi:drug/metabolite transporter (DMT)-like permease
MTGGTFVCCQVALLCVFREPISLKRWAGIAIITLGVILASMSQ